MKDSVTYLANYALYHRDQRNIATHFFGIPIIVLSILCLTVRPSFSLVLSDTVSITANLALVLYLVSSLFYLRLDIKLGVLMALFHGVLLYLASLTSTLDFSVWLIGSVGLFVAGWALQFVGHYYEGKKPAFVDDIMGLVIGPLFVMAELCFLLRTRADLQQQIEAQAGPVKPLS